ncbi:type VI secretion system-associated protein TagF [Sphingomonas montanisoli]|uniref:Type VI secretion system-associated protein TagF n=1 Tax=Sphingomonas montanisoli TaxID=2606412 RepID=A0A5D9CBQ7_9SPHN|nr:type VI secretion system-associated protein TagF [Sphingomonas montanisoli]TZG27551.1 type VI secretion system-associated protein TagF [Sphingomonas montanisoli]
MNAFVFGKLPTHRDFVVRGLDAAARAWWDGWLSGQLSDARRTLGDAAFEDAYDRAPVWRFLLTHDDVRMAGALAPSVDGAGRRFPIVAALYGNVGDDAAALCEDRLYDGFDQGWQVDQLYDALAASAVGGGAASCEDRWWTLGNDEFPEATLSGEHPEGLWRMMILPGGAN